MHSEQKKRRGINYVSRYIARLFFHSQTRTGGVLGAVPSAAV